MRSEQKRLQLKKFNKYDLMQTYGVGYCNNGEIFLFDLDCYDLIKDYCWYRTNSGYIATRYNSRKVLLHKLILGDIENKHNIDHINHNKYDNRKINLRFVTRSQNNINKSIQRNNTSGVPGVQWHNRDKVWEVYITINNKKTYMGRYTDFAQAVLFRKQLEQKYYGEFSYDNSQKFIQEIGEI